MVRPFVLRRVKTDPNVIDDLPDCTETKEYATLTVEQATMYQQAVNAMLGQVDRASGIQRRGLVLATLVKLKQICNHPAQAGSGAHSEQAELSETESAAPQALPSTTIAPSPEALSARSGKAKRLMVMLEEVIASGEKALIFTQFRQMGHLLTAMIQHDLDCEALFLHGGTPAAKRQHLIDRFQSNDGGVPIFVLSLKAGGLGLNLTAANHVFHYDRWWNPAVENQATDRAFRIGQMRAVQVHKFVCLGTLEERIDQMIEQKTELAQNIIGAGEQWLTELSTNQLHDLLMLRPSAMEGES
jgi:SNF2 family DNA or RNA helicase